MTHLPLLFLLAVLTACSEQTAPPPELPRVVRTLTIAERPVAAEQTFSGEVKARHESRLAFRVSGKIMERLVDVGASVKAGQPLARVDANDLALAARAADARVDAASTALDQARANFNRFTKLREKNFISEAELERYRSAFDAATAALESARSEAALIRNQLDYTTLKAPTDGVITSIDAEAGQVVAAGAPVMMFAREGEREIAIFVPEDKLDALRAASAIRVSLWAAPKRQWPGRVREISPAADPLTRTYAARISVADDGALHLGLTATVKLTGQAADARIRLPTSALMQDGAGHAVWRVENNIVHRQAVSVDTTTGNEVLIHSGLAPGQVVVTAGAHLLHEGQSVRPQAGP
jgi:RND family efflux transporter MFP subunit